MLKTKDQNAMEEAELMPFCCQMIASILASLLKHFCFLPFWGTFLSTVCNYLLLIILTSYLNNNAASCRRTIPILELAIETSRCTIFN